MSGSGDGLKCLVVDDDPVVRETIEAFARNTWGIAYCLKAADATSARAVLASNVFDLAFIDLHLPDLDGVSLIKALPPGLPVVVVSADSSFGAESYDYNVVDYLLKPVAFERFERSLERARDFLRGGGGDAPAAEAEASPVTPFFVRDSGRLVKIDPAELLHVRGESNYVQFVTRSGSHLVLLSLKKLERELAPGFVRVHRSFIVNRAAIERVDGEHVVVAGERLPVGASYKARLIASLRLVQ